MGISDESCRMDADWLAPTLIGSVKPGYWCAR
jgi:hypothetical protein